MAETGFGSPSFSPAPTYADWGFGSATPFDLDTLEENIVGRDTGFGSPYAAVQQAVFLTGEFDIIPDDGGVILEINSDWSTAGFLPIGLAGPFEVNYISASTGEQYPAIGLEVANNCYTNYTQTKLYAGVPPLPHGSYSVRIEWFNGTRTVSIDNAFTVALRPRCEQAYGLRRHIPSWLARGAVSARNEPHTAWEQGSNIEALTKSIGDLLQVFYGRPSTCTAEVFTFGDTSLSVESTIGFADSGKLVIENIEFSYTSKIVSTFEGVSTTRQFTEIMSGLEVYYVDTPV